MEITLSRVVDAARQRRAALTAEAAGYIVLRVLQRLASCPRQVSADQVGLTAAGEVELAPSAPGEARDVEMELRRLLASLLGLSQSAPPALKAICERASLGDLAALEAELAAALIPINHAAQGRALARLFRETHKAASGGSAAPSERQSSALPPASQASETPRPSARASVASALPTPLAPSVVLPPPTVSPAVSAVLTPLAPAVSAALTPLVPAASPSSEAPLELVELAIDVEIEEEDDTSPGVEVDYDDVELLFGADELDELLAAEVPAPAAVAVAAPAAVAVAAPAAAPAPAAATAPAPAPAAATAPAPAATAPAPAAASAAAPAAATASAPRVPTTLQEPVSATPPAVSELLASPLTPPLPASSDAPELFESPVPDSSPFASYGEPDPAPQRSDLRELLNGYLAHTRCEEHMTADLRRMIGLDPWRAAGAAVERPELGR